jgi:hypothetical protein
VGRSEHTFGTNDTHCTPAAVYEPVLEALRIDRFGLDPFGNPASPVPADTVILLPDYWSTLWAAEEDDASETATTLYLKGDAYAFDWGDQGAVFCNGPTSACAPWAEKMAGDEGGDENVSLWPVRTRTNWWQKWVAPSDAILFWRGGIKFVGSPWQAPWSSALSYVGPRADLFAEGMAKYGWIVRNPRDWD